MSYGVPWTATKWRQTCNGQAIERKERMKYLGITFDRSLSFKYHSDRTSHKPKHRFTAVKTMTLKRLKQRLLVILWPLESEIDHGTSSRDRKLGRTPLEFDQCASGTISTYTNPHLLVVAERLRTWPECNNVNFFYHTHNHSFNMIAWGELVRIHGCFFLTHVVYQKWSKYHSY